MQLLTQGWLLAIDRNNAGKEEGWFSSGPTADARPAPVPGIIQQVFPDYHGLAWYWCRFTPAAPLPAHSRWQLHFHGGVDYLGEAWLNGQYLGCYEGGEAPSDLDATAAMRPGADNLLAVRVLNPTHDAIDGYRLREVPHRNKAMPCNPGASFNFGGILRPVKVRAVPAVRVIDAFVRPDPRTGCVPVTLTLRNEAGEPLGAKINTAIGPAVPAGPAVTSRTGLATTLAPGDTTVELALQVDQPHLWDLNDPYLYRVTLRSQAEIDGEVVEDEYTLRCGFRDFRVERGFFRLNGRRIFVRSTHTGDHYPQGQAAPVDPDLVRRDLIMARAAGFNMVRFISGVALPDQLGFADELGLLVYEENMAAWGLLNETVDGPVFRHAVDYLPRLRTLDPTRLVLLSSGRWDCQWQIGSVSNPGGTTWEHQWGAEALDTAPAEFDGIWKPNHGIGAYCAGAGDAHIYPWTPQTDATNDLLRTLGRDTKPVFLSEYGIGSLLNVLRETRCFEQAGARSDLFDVTMMRNMADSLRHDWQRWGFEGVYAFPKDMLKDSQRRHARQQLLGFDLIRANPQLCGYNLTGILDHAITGEGLWTFHREWKPGIVDALADGWAPVRWCLFANPRHAYAGRPIHLEAVLANEDVLPLGSYPVSFRIIGPQGIVWQQQAGLLLPPAPPGGDAPLAVPALATDVTLDLPAGAYEFAAYMEHGGAPAGGRLKFYLSDPGALPPIAGRLTLWGLSPAAEDWLRTHGAATRSFAAPPAAEREVILVGAPPEDERDLTHWCALARRMAQGGTALFLPPAAFARGQDSVAWLPLAVKGRCYEFHDWLYHKECVAKDHPAFAGLPARGILDWDFYGQVIPHWLFDGQQPPDDVAAAAFATGYPIPGGYASGVLLGAYAFGAGRCVLNTFPITEHLGCQPAADRLLVNLIAYAAAGAQEPLAALPDDFGDMLARIGYTQ